MNEFAAPGAAEKSAAAIEPPPRAARPDALSFADDGVRVSRGHELVQRVLEFALPTKPEAVTPQQPALPSPLVRAAPSAPLTLDAIPSSKIRNPG